MARTWTRVAAETEESHEERRPRRWSQGVNICFIATALQPGNGLILTVGSARCTSDTNITEDAVKAPTCTHGIKETRSTIYIRRNVGPLNTGMIHVLATDAIRSSHLSAVRGFAI